MKEKGAIPMMEKATASTVEYASSVSRCLAILVDLYIFSPDAF